MHVQHAENHVEDLFELIVSFHAEPIETLTGVQTAHNERILLFTATAVRYFCLSERPGIGFALENSLFVLRLHLFALLATHRVYCRAFRHCRFLLMLLLWELRTH